MKNASVVESAYTSDLKSDAFGIEGSSPSTRTTLYLAIVQGIEQGSSKP